MTPEELEKVIDAVEARILSKLPALIRASVREHPVPGLTVKQAAAAIGCSPSSIRNYERAGDLVARFPDQVARYHADDVEQFQGTWGRVTGRRRRKPSKLGNPGKEKEV